MSETKLLTLQGPAGTRDFYPKDLAIRSWLFNDIWRNVCQLFGYSEYDAPILERSDLYKRKGGDDILKEMYIFTDKEEHEVCLRPEMTPSVARMVMSIYKSVLPPLKWYSIAQCWRFENISKGRKREHYQLNVDNFGAEPVKSEVEILCIMVEIFKKLGLTPDDVVLKISHRMILQKILIKLGVSFDHIERAFNIIDKIQKITREELYNLLETEIGLSTESIELVMKLVNITHIENLTEFLDEHDETLTEMHNIFQLAELANIMDWLQFDVSVVRGLSYYTGMIFEGFFRNLSWQRSICGGGRYDNLLEKYGYSERVPAVGFGCGDIVILEGLTELKRLPKINNSVDYCLISYADDLYGRALTIATELRKRAKSVTVYMKCDGRLRKAFNYADKIGAQIVILIAPNEIAENKIVVKNMRSDENKMITIEISEYLRQLD